MIIRIAAMGDLHFGVGSIKTFAPMFKAVSDEADVLVLCGDLTTKGLLEEARELAEAMESVKIPMVSVLGNHDHEANNQEEIMDILEEAGVKVLERGAFIMEGHSVGFCGTKGFCGGFTPARIAPFGERILKMFINETYKEANKVNRALKNMRASFKVVVYHYAPIRETCMGEHCEIIPFLGSSILSDPVDTFKPNLVLHGHSHHGKEKGYTAAGVPVRNVSLPIHGGRHVVYDMASFIPSAPQALKQPSAAQGSRGPSPS
ncbi:putative phosphoesterase [Methanocella conradii HZ254]|uniref:Phosphoesterase n=1 Tax=Methanocella conradii (strain DSM 24694 / JCM 17849 / CGMCC 1.5162 / HZ254) TaxID=1041930 RepID=H8IA01_METCZ|nr:metallophosphoesterase [Methanocella conradii]AFD00961.1 putative phosphoesterase [Methanocella conradii HZ254]MDI6897691.1 metallophosphoesterase [Methanocella conradii]